MARSGRAHPGGLPHCGQLVVDTRTLSCDLAAADECRISLLISGGPRYSPQAVAHDGGSYELRIGLAASVAGKTR